mmetsp:Transcript_19136/g.48621  ORF Transcript_19136/g.48621 Transcript_19136/m.48621 type:complete len:242 (+) Transcript_19136:708-1433(+)
MPSLVMLGHAGPTRWPQPAVLMLGAPSGAAGSEGHCSSSSSTPGQEAAGGCHPVTRVMASRSHQGKQLLRVNMRLMCCLLQSSSQCILMLSCGTGCTARACSRLCDLARSRWYLKRGACCSAAIWVVWHATMRECSSSSNPAGSSSIGSSSHRWRMTSDQAVAGRSSSSLGQGPPSGSVSSAASPRCLAAEKAALRRCASAQVARKEMATVSCRMVLSMRLRPALPCCCEPAVGTSWVPLS